MIGKCISDCCGDYSDITIGKTYEILKEKDFLMYVANGTEHTEVKYLIKDDLGEEYWYPVECFELIEREILEAIEMKLFRVEVMNDCEEETIIIVAESRDEAEDKVKIMDWSCLMFCTAYEISEVDGYKINLEKLS